MAIKVYILEYRYPESGVWYEYDRTRIKKYAQNQMEQMKKEYPGLHYRMTEKK